MYGEDGWCHSCGVALREQTGSMIVKIPPKAVPIGVWTPNWQFDSQVLSEDLAAMVASRFSVRLIPVELRPPSSRPQQVVPTVMASPWFDHQLLVEATTARHGSPGNTCQECGVWRWYGLGFEQLPPATRSSEWDGHDVVASPEWFGDGCNAYREVLFRRELAELIVAANPRRAKIIEVNWA